jgi:hypothetical protein
MSLTLIHYLVQHGWTIWREYHPYFADHARGGWYEWLARR